jgi:hypothetical protein
VQIVAGRVSLDLQTSHRAHLAGLDLDVDAVTITGGIVSTERCTMNTRRGVQLVDCVASMRWSAASGQEASGVKLQNAHLHASDSTFTTAAGGADRITHGGVEIAGTSACHLALCSLFGAWPATAAKPWPSSALLASTAGAANARIWLVDCNFVGGYQASGLQGPSLIAPSVLQPRARVHRCQATGPVIGTVEQGRVLGVHTPADMQVGTTFTTRMQGDPGDPLLLYAGGETLGLIPFPMVEQPALMFSDMVVLGTILANGQGFADFPLAVPNNPSLRHLQIWWRGLDLVQLPWQATPAFVTIVQ